MPFPPFLLGTRGFCLDAPSHKTLLSIPPILLLDSPGMRKGLFLSSYSSTHWPRSLSLEKPEQIYFFSAPEDIRDLQSCGPFKNKQKGSLPLAPPYCHTTQITPVITALLWTPSTAIDLSFSPHMTQHGEPWTLSPSSIQPELLCIMLHSWGNEDCSHRPKLLNADLFCR